MMYNVIMISEELKDKRIANAEWACREAGTDWAKDYWFGVFSKLCEMYNRQEHFRKVIH